MKVGSFKGVLLLTLVIASVVVLALSLSFNGIVSALPGGLTPHDPIYIDGNAGFTPANGVTSGSGTENDPYIIENWIISAENAHGIWIEDTDAYFVVCNCVVENGKSHFHDGIYLDNVTNGKIENNTCKNNDWAGIWLRGSLNILVGNTCVNNDERGIDMGGSSNTLINNTCSNSSGPGIIIYGSSHTLASNTCSTNGSTGIRLYGSLNTLDNNTCSNNNNGPGIQVMSSSSSNTLINNTCSNNSVLAGISVSGSSHTLVSNTCSTNSYNGIKVYRSDNNTLDNNTCSNNGSNGIFLVGSDSNLLTNNTCENNDECGIKTEIYYPPIPLSSSPLTEEDVDPPENNSIFHNCLLSNGGNNAYDEGSNYWDDGYSSGGNYWGDYTGEDNYRGENQDIPGSDGIGDTPYNIPGGANQDRYPLMNPWPLVRGVEVSISPDYQEGLPGGTIEYEVTVTNTGNAWDTYDLSASDTEGWGLILDSGSLSIPASESRTTTLIVTIPGNAVCGTEDNITVTATSQADPSVSDSASCVAYALPKPGGLTPHDPIYIDGNAGFTPANGVTSGSGTENDPYVIEEWGISAESAHGIWIKNTTAYFVIRNCYVHDGGSSYIGIYLDNVRNGRIEYNVCESNYDGIYLYKSDNNTLTNNTICFNNDNGILLHYSFNNRIYHNNFIDNPNQARDEGSNYWDDGYPSGGNHWSDYTGVDENRGENQDIAGSDGIGDTPYYIPGDDNQDRYPLVYPSEAPVPYLPPGPDWVRLEAISIEENAYVEVEITFPCPGYDVNWGSVTRIDDLTFSADAKIWEWPGYPFLVITEESHVYDLGALPSVPPGIYEFIFKAWGTPIKSLQFAHPLGLENALKLVTLYEVNLDVDLWLENNSKLVVKFYTWGDDFEAENVVWSGTAPDNVVLLEDIPHPQGKAVEKARLDLTHDNTENVISTIASYTVRKVDLEARFLEIPFYWSGADPAGKLALETEFLEIPFYWSGAPS